MAASIEVAGLRELRSALRKVDESMIDMLTVANKKTATFVVSRSSAAASGMGRQTANAASTLKAGTAGRSATVKLRNTQAVPYAIGMEFGANHNRPRRTRRGVMRGWNMLPTRAPKGRFLYPTIEKDQQQIVDIYMTELGRLLDRYFPAGG